MLVIVLSKMPKQTIFFPFEVFYNLFFCVHKILILPKSFQSVVDTVFFYWRLIIKKVIQQQTSYGFLHKFAVGRMKDYEAKVTQGEVFVHSLWKEKDISDALFTFTNPMAGTLIRYPIQCKGSMSQVHHVCPMDPHPAVTRAEFFLIYSIRRGTKHNTPPMVEDQQDTELCTLHLGVIEVKEETLLPKCTYFWAPYKCFFSSSQIALTVG